MTTLYRLFAKETRALAPAWAAIVAGMVAASGPIGLLRGFAIPVYFVGVAALAALSIGHEYSYRTLPALLAQPVSRRLVLLIKWLTLAVLLLPLAWLADLLYLRSVARTQVVWLPPLFALCVVPLMTMICRNPLAGAVFGMAIPGLPLIASDVIGRRIYAPSIAAAEYDAFRIAFVSWTSVAICGIAAVLTWYVWIRLQAIEGPADVPLPAWAARRSAAEMKVVAATVRHPMWLLVKKELRLQSLPLAIAALYVIVRAIVAATVTMDNDVGSVTVILSQVYAGAVAVLIGSMAIAEERQLGTLESQLLQPVAVWKQGAVKAATAIALALVLAIGIPALTFYFSPVLYNNRPGGVAMFLLPNVIATGVVMTIGALYVSSVCTSGLWALLVSLPALYLADLFARFIAWPLYYKYTGGARAAFFRTQAVRDTLRAAFGPRGAYDVLTAALAVVVSVICLAVVSLAIANCRYADRRGARWSLQLATLMGCVLAWVFASGFFWRLQ